MTDILPQEVTADQRIVKMIVKDLGADAIKLDGVPFTARGMGETFGTLMATTQALAKIVDHMLQREASQ